MPRFHILGYLVYYFTEIWKCTSDYEWPGKNSMSTAERETEEIKTYSCYSDQQLWRS